MGSTLLPKTALCGFLPVTALSSLSRLSGLRSVRGPRASSNQPQFTPLAGGKYQLCSRYHSLPEQPCPFHAQIYLFNIVVKLLKCHTASAAAFIDLLASQATASLTILTNSLNGAQQSREDDLKIND